MFQELFEKHLMIALQMQDFEVLQGVANQVFDHQAGVGAAINIVPQIDQQQSLVPMGLGILVDLCVQFLQQVDPPMNIPHRIDAGVAGRIAD